MLKLLSRHSRRNPVYNLFCDRTIEIKKPKIYYVYSAGGSIRFASSVENSTGKTVSLFDKIPEPPPIPESSDISEVVQSLSANGEPTFASLGLGGWGPVGIIQNCFEYLHVSLDIPWWGAIVIGTIVVRSLMFPLVIISQKNAALMNNNLPEMQALQLKMTQARQTGNLIDSARYAQEMVTFMKEKKISPLKNALVPLAQAPLFISFFVGLRGMANCPVESMTTGGLWWFADLTVPDQYYLMPLLTSATMWAAIELGVDGGRLEAQNMAIIKYVLRAIPFVMLPFTVNFPGAILLYWCSSNFMSLIQVGVLKIPAVRKYFNITEIITYKPDNLPIKKKGFVAGAKDSWTNIKISRELADRQRIDEIMFTRAGKGPIQKTYKYDPTKLSSVQAKSK